mgnify:CR=1 FL=1
MNLRPSKINDLALLFDIHQSVFRSHIEKLWGWDEDWQRENFASECATSETSVIEVDGHIAGYIQLLEQESLIYIQNIAISPTFQGKGIGTLLLKNLQSSAAVKKITICLGVFQTNRSAQRLYEQLGFHTIGKTDTHINMSWVPPLLSEEFGNP